MKQILIGLSVIALAGAVAPPANGAGRQTSEALAGACKDKVAGQTVKIEDKDVPCPTPGDEDRKKTVRVPKRTLIPRSQSSTEEVYPERLW